ncbi:unnamed protein product [Angiostrongylus costaricensis]|uniref:Transposase n=1 Tax=Angiostrongylus costaricensis TaxID=334426 RepID=A0A0R3PTY2_ANGCS|nr:unnamed protein product [Angiostrongylus costaricensis]
MVINVSFLSIAAGKLLKVDEYLLLPTQKKGSITAALRKKTASEGVFFTGLRTKTIENAVSESVCVKCWMSR